LDAVHILTVNFCRDKPYTSAVEQIPELIGLTDPRVSRGTWERRGGSSKKRRAQRISKSVETCAASWGCLFGYLPGR